MQINNNFGRITNAVSVINNPNTPWGTLIEEIPCDIGRSYAGYKRGGILEGAEKMRKELMGAAVWLFGIRAFNKAGNYILENIFKIPTAIDYSNAEQGRDCIKDSVMYLTKGENPNGLDVSELKKYGDKFKNLNPDTLIKNVRNAKQITSIIAVLLNCIAMGLIIPKINQALTERSLKKQQKNETKTYYKTIDDYRNETKKNNNVSFKGKITDYVTYNTENNNTFRLVVTDIPMIIGRMVTSRNKYEALEFLVMDGGSVFFYNFCSDLIQKGLRNVFKVPHVNPKTAELLSTLTPEEVDNVLKNKQAGSLEKMFGNKEFADNIYKQATYGNYGKINKFVKDQDLEKINKSVIDTLEHVKQKAKGQMLTQDEIKNIIKKINVKNDIMLGVGLTVSIIGLAILMPKLTFALTKKLTGKDQFTGIAHYDDDKKDKKC